jgi:signal transduction histidine kinase
MEVLTIILSALTVIVIASVVLILHKERRQVKEVAEALSDVRGGDGNRRVLAGPGQLLSPLVYEINDIIRTYEDRIADFRQTEEANKQLMTSLSHDVRTPLTTLIGYLDAAHKGVVTGAEREEYIETARRKAYDLKDYIDILFDWFRLNSDEFALSMQQIEAAELTRSILIDWIPLLEDQKIEYAIKIPDRPVMVNADPDSYMRILNNLMQNVLVHSRADAVTVLLTTREDTMRLSVADNGVGIAKADLKQIFSRLYKCDRGRSEKGSGLGLSIACQLAEKMGGQLSADSSPGEGAAFILTLPLATSDTPPETAGH